MGTEGFPMIRIVSSFFAATLLALGLDAGGAQAQTRVFVAAQGSDSNPCTFALPCRTFQHAHNVVVVNGEIDVLDPAGYGALTITKAISLQGHGFSGISASSGNAITINAGAGDLINLRGLLLDGVGSGTAGIEFNSGASLNIQDSMIRNFVTFGINFQPTAASQLNVSQTIISDLGAGGTGVSITPAGSGSAIAVLDHVRIQHGFNGLVGLAASGTINATVIGSVISNFSQLGIGIVGAPTVVRVTRSTITANATGLSAVSSGSLISYGDNSIDGNTAPGAFTSTTLLH
jgi:hypothetical protein